MIGLMFLAVLAIYIGVGLWGLIHFFQDLPKQPGVQGPLRYAIRVSIAFMAALFSWYLVSCLSTNGKSMAFLALVESVWVGPPALWLLTALLVGHFAEKRPVLVGTAMASGAAGGFLLLYDDWLRYGLKIL